MANQQSQNQGQAGSNKNFGTGSTHQDSSTQKDRSSQQGRNMEYSSESDMGNSKQAGQQRDQTDLIKQSNTGSQESSQRPGKTGMDQSGLEKPDMNKSSQANKQGQNKI